MARIVVLNTQGIEPSIGRYDFLIQGDPSALGLTAAVGSIAIQVDSTPKGQLWEKTSASDSGWVTIGSNSSAGNASASGAYRASAYNVPVDGTDATATFNTLAGTTIPQTGGPYTVVLGPTDVLQFAADYTIPANVRIQSFGGVIKPASGKKVTLMTQPESAGKMFDLSAGGTVVAGVPMSVRPEWWGAFSTGAAVAATDGLSITAAIGMLAAGGGGSLVLSQMYAVDEAARGQSHAGLFFTGDTYANISVVATQPGAGLKHAVDSAFPVTGGGAILTFVGSGSYTLKNIKISGVTFQGNSTSDSLNLLSFSGVDGVRVENCTFLNCSREGFTTGGANTCKNVEVVGCRADSVGVGGQKLAAINVNAEHTLIQSNRVTNCGQGIEQTGSNSRILGNHFDTCSAYCALIASTWSAYLDGGGVEVDDSTIMVSNNVFLNSPAAIITGDSSGRTANGHTFLGNQGRIMIANNIAIKCDEFFAGGADSLTEIVIRDNYLDDSSAAGTPCIVANRGRFVIENNTFRLGPTSAWAGVIRCGDQDPLNTSGIIQYNTIVGKAWAAAPAFLLGPEITLCRNIIENVAVDSSAYYDFAGTNYVNDGPVSRWSLTDTWFVQSDPDMVYSAYQPSRLRVNGSFPLKGTWKLGDRAENVAAASGPGWVCTTAGTADTILSGVTISTTSGSTTFTVTAGLSKVARYQWVTIPGVTGAKQFVTYNPTSGVGTFQSTASATVVSATPAYSPPVWTATNNAATLSIASQAAGDMLYANSTTTFTRMAKGVDGTTVTYIGGVPTAVDSIARYDAGNSSTAITVTRTPARQQQKITLSTATPAITIDDTAIPSGGYLITDFFQDGTGSRVPTWALTSAGTINWVGGSAPTLTTTAGKADKIVWENEGSRITASLTWQNF